MARVLEAASNEHERLVKTLIEKFLKDGFKIRQASYPGFNEPEKAGRHAPDVRAYDDKAGLNVIGEAKTCDDLTSDKSKEQFEDFSSRQMTEGKSQGKVVPFHVIVPETCEQQLAVVLQELGIVNKPNVYRWSMA
jgi:hypothetical protein